MDVGGQHVSSLLVNPNVKLPAVSSADYTAVAALLQQLLAAVVFAGSEIITISPSLRSGEIMQEHKVSYRSSLPAPLQKRS